MLSCEEMAKDKQTGLQETYFQRYPASSVVSSAKTKTDHVTDHLTDHSNDTYEKLKHSELACTKN